MSQPAAIALGSNLPSAAGDSAATLTAAIERLRGLGNVIAVSTFHDTAPVGPVEQPRFLNAALLLDTRLNPPELMRAMLEIERSLGRVRDGALPNGPRTLDLDLLLYDSQMIVTPDLILPHPAMHERLFVLEPLVEIAPRMVHPGLGSTVAEMLDRIRSSSTCTP